MKQLFQTSSVIESVSTRHDGTLKVVIGTQECSPEQMATLFGLKSKQGWMLFSENEISMSDVPKESAPEFKQQKSLSARLYAILFVYWNSCTDKKVDFEKWREVWVNRKIDEIKELLPKTDNLA